MQMTKLVKNKTKLNTSDQLKWYTTSADQWLSKQSKNVYCFLWCNIKPSNITCGVQQGFTLGSLLFTLYVSDLLLATNFDFKLFADDTNLTMSH